MKTRAIGLGLIIAAGAGVAVFAVTRDSDEPAPAAAGSAANGGAIARQLGAVSGRDLAVGNEHHYAVELAHTSKQSAGQPFSLAVAGEWVLGVVPTTTPTTTTLRAELRDPQVTIGSTKSPAPKLAVPYSFTIGHDGRLLALQFPRDLDTETRMLLTALTASAQVTEGGRATTWTSVETDSLGPYDVRYSRDTSIHKTKLGYRKTAAAGDQPLAVRVVASATDIALRADGWPDSIRQREELEVGLEQMSVTVAGHISLRHIGVNRGFATLPENLETVAIDATSTANRDADERELLDGATLVDLIATLGSVRDDHHASTHTYLRLVALFRLDSEAAKAGGQAVLGGKLDPRDAGAVIAALGEAGTPVAQHALVAVVEATTLSSDQRLHGAMSLGLTATPTAETVATLATASRSADPQVASTATLALGNAAQRMQHQDPAGSAAQVDELLARLRTAEGTDRITLLRALGNTGDARVLPALEVALKSASDFERAAATESLRLVPDVRADALILISLEDRSSTVRASAVFAASYRPLDPVLGALAIRARADDDVTIRRAIVELAATRMSELPALRPIVTYAAEHDADAELREAAKKFLT